MAASAGSPTCVSFWCCHDAARLDVAFLALLGAAEPAEVGPLTDRTYRSPPLRTTHMVTGSRRLSSRRSEAVCSSSASPILVSSSLVHSLMRLLRYPSGVMPSRRRQVSASFRDGRAP